VIGDGQILREPDRRDRARHGRGGSTLQGLAELGFHIAFGPPLLRVADQGAQILAGRGIALLGHLDFDESLHFIGHGNVHGRHEGRSS
jgi:hypothetical protein